MHKIDLLDHGFVRLVDYMGGDLSVVRAARVSYDAAWRAGEESSDDAKLIRYLWKHRHTTPFEAVTLTFEVMAPILVFRQWHRHRTQSYNELSARYRELPEKYYVPSPYVVGVQSTSSKQGRKTDNLNDGELIEVMSELYDYKRSMEQAFLQYHALLEKGWPRELARAVLPVATYSHMFTTMNLLNLFRFMTLRADSHAQYEIRVYAEAMAKLAHHVAPVSVTAWSNDP